MYAFGTGSIIQNLGTIIIDGKSYKGNEANATIVDSNGNKAMAANGGGTIKNAGTITTNGLIDLTSTSDNQGKVILQKGSTISADNIKGKFYASSDITKDLNTNRKNIYIAKNIIQTKSNLNTNNLLSNSAMFEAKLKKVPSTINSLNSGINTYNIIMTRIPFTKILKDTSLANALEHSYNNDFSKENIKYFNMLKSISSKSELIKTIKSSFNTRSVGNKQTS